jgi:hypothetical protein
VSESLDDEGSCHWIGEELIIYWMVQTFLYALPARWYMASIVKTEFKGTTFAGAHLVPDAPPGSPAFACDPGTPSCYGYTGEQVTHQGKWDIL